MSNSSSASVVQRHRRRARKAKLAYINDFDEGITRRRCGKGFVYLSPTGKILKSARVRQRIESLVIPPAWKDVWICPRACGHIQARGLDDAGRTQYVYHERWEAVRAETKFHRMAKMAGLLPRIRRRVSRDLRGRKLTKERVLAAIVRLLDKAYLRVGNDQYVRQNGSRGATTLAADHVEVRGFAISLDFPGKSGQRHEIEFTDRRTAKVIRQCEEIDGQFLFCYCNGAGDFRRVHSTDVNDYLRDIAGETVTTKDFRTWWGSVLALDKLADMEEDCPEAQRKKTIANAVAAAAEALGNTKTVCRKSYIHPGILTSAASGDLPRLLSKAKRSKKTHSGLTSAEAMLASVLPHLDRG